MILQYFYPIMFYSWAWAFIQQHFHCQLNHNKIDGTYGVQNQNAFHLRCFLIQENTKSLQKNNFKQLVLFISSRSLFLHIGQKK